jgi:hypothetical protein
VSLEGWGDPYYASLGQWSYEQRRLHAANELREDRYQLLLEVGFQFNVDDALWEETLHAYRDISEELGYPLLDPDDDTFSGSSWVHEQRRLHAANELREDRYQQLLEVGFIFNVDETIWNFFFEELLEFRRRFDHVNVPPSYQFFAGWVWSPPREQDLGSWLTVNEQRRLYRANELGEERYQRLLAVGLVFHTSNTLATGSM